MIKQIKTYLLVIIIGIILLFSWFWTEGFVTVHGYQYGGTVEKALNFRFERGVSNTGLLNVKSTVDVDKNGQLNKSHAR